MTWNCPDCGRPFAAPNRAHACAPGLTEQEYFATGPPHERPIYEAVRPVVDRIAAQHGPGELIVEFVSVGVFFKRRRNFAELRPMTKWVRLSLNLDHHLDSPRIASRNANHVNLRTPDEVDDDIEAWLTEAYLAAAPRRAGGSKPR